LYSLRASVMAGSCISCSAQSRPGLRARLYDS
jgi:hypothetical protein